MAWGLVAGAAIAGGATLLGARSASRASDRATAAASDASAQNLALAREQRASNEALYAPELARGATADRMLDQLYGFSPGTFGGTSAGSVYGGGAPSARSASAGEAYLAAYPDVNEEAMRQISNRRSAFFGADPADYAAWHYSNFGAGEGRVSPNELQAVAAGPEAAGAAYGGAPVPGNLNTLYTQTEPFRLGEQQFADAEALTDQAYSDMGAEIETARTGLDAEAAANLARLRAELGSQYDTRRGFTDTAVANLRALRDLDEQRGTDRIASTIGVDGMIGKAGRAVADQSYARNLEFAGTERDWRNQDFDPYATGTNAALATYGDVRDRNAVNYYAQRQGNLDTRTNRRFGSLDARGNSRMNAYANWENYLRSQSDRGGVGRTNISSGNATYTQAGMNANNQRANAAAANAQNQSNIWGGAANNIASIAGNVYGAWNYNRNRGGGGGGGYDWNALSRPVPRIEPWR